MNDKADSESRELTAEKSMNFQKRIPRKQKPPKASVIRNTQGFR